MRKSWRTPKLVILIRGTAGEFVLLTCKYPTVPTTSGPLDGKKSCKNPPSGDTCGKCSETDFAS
jgi:hypothetical protein